MSTGKGGAMTAAGGKFYIVGGDSLVRPYPLSSVVQVFDPAMNSRGRG